MVDRCKPGGRRGASVPRLREVSGAAVEVRNLVKRYDVGHVSVTAVDGLTLAAPAAAVTAVLGPNGAGKTTTVEICAGLRRQDAGTVRILGLDPRRDARRLRSRLGVMPQSGSASGVGVAGMTRAREALALFASYFASPLPVDPLLERVGLTAVAGTPWRRLSGGEQQRLSLGLAIVGRPELVFLDEPTAGLDVHARVAVFDLIRELRASGVSVVLTTHLLDEAEQLADQIFIVDAGRVVASGTPDELTRSETNTVRFDGPTGLVLDSLIEALPSGSDARETSAGRYAVTGAVDPGFLAAVTAWCASNGVMPRGLSTGSRSLEDVFLEVTGRGSRR